MTQMSYTGAAQPAPAPATPAGYVFYKGMFDYIFATFNALEAAAVVKDANGTIGVNNVNAVNTNPALTPIYAKAVAGQVANMLLLQDSAGGNLFAVSVVGDAALARNMAVAGTLVVTGAISGSLAGNAASASAVPAAGIAGTIGAAQIDAAIARAANVPTNAGAGATGLWAGITIGGGQITRGTLPGSAAAGLAYSISATPLAVTVAGDNIWNANGFLQFTQHDSPPVPNIAGILTGQARIDLLYLDASGNLLWQQGTPVAAASATIPAPPTSVFTPIVYQKTYSGATAITGSTDLGHDSSFYLDARAVRYVGAGGGLIGAHSLPLNRVQDGAAAQTTPASTTINLAALGYFNSVGVWQDFAGGTYVYPNSSLLNAQPRWDLLYLDDNRNVATAQGSPSGTPTKPVRQIGQWPVAFVYLPPNTVSIVDQANFTGAAGQGYLLPAPGYVSSLSAGIVGTTATAHATISGGAVNALVVDAGGAGYPVPPTVVFAGGGGTGAAATAVISGGAVTGFTGLVGGTGYTSAPTVTLTTSGAVQPLSLGGTGATAAAAARSNLGAAQSGSNGDITAITGLTSLAGNVGFGGRQVFTGTVVSDVPMTVSALGGQTGHLQDWKVGGTAVGWVDAAANAVAPLADRGGQVYNVKAYGAKGDGATDDTAAIIAAFNAATGSATAGGTIFFPPGRYKISSTLSVNAKVVNVIGSGGYNGTSSDYIAGTATVGSVLVWAGGAGPMLSVTNCAAIEIAGLVFDGNSVATYGLELVNLRNSTVHHLQILRCAAADLRLTTASTGANQANWTDAWNTFDDIMLTNATTPFVVDPNIQGVTTTATASTLAGATAISVASAPSTALFVGDYITVGAGGTADTVQVTAIAGLTLTVTAMAHAHTSGAAVVKPLTAAGDLTLNSFRNFFIAYGLVGGDTAPGMSLGASDNNTFQDFYFYRAAGTGTAIAQLDAVTAGYASNTNTFIHCGGGSAVGVAPFPSISVGAGTSLTTLSLDRGNGWAEPTVGAGGWIAHLAKSGTTSVPFTVRAGTNALLDGQQGIVSGSGANAALVAFDRGGGNNYGYLYRSGTKVALASSEGFELPLNAATGRITPDAYTAITPVAAHGWSNAGGAYNNLGWMTQSDGTIRLRGVVVGTTPAANGRVANGIIGVLPAAAIPAKEKFLAAFSGSGTSAAYLLIDQSGNLYAFTGGTTSFSVDDLTYDLR